MHWIGDKEYTNQEYQEMRERQWAESKARYEAQARAEEADRQESSRLIRQLGAAYTEYTHFIEGRPHLRVQAPGGGACQEPDGESGDRLFYEQLRRNLGHADDAPRCAHIKPDGIRCGSPRLKTGELCYAHQRMLESCPQKLRLPPMEDPNSIQLGLMEVSRALVDRQISEKTAGLLLYALQNAASNVDRLTFHKRPKEMVIEEAAPQRPPAAAQQREVAGPNSSIYEDLDDDLKLKLQEIGDEFDRRRAERSRPERTSVEEVCLENRSGHSVANPEIVAALPAARMTSEWPPTGEIQFGEIQFGEVQFEDPGSVRRLPSGDYGPGDVHTGTGG